MILLMFSSGWAEAEKGKMKRLKKFKLKSYETFPSQNYPVCWFSD